MAEAQQRRGERSKIVLEVYWGGGEWGRDSLCLIISDSSRAKQDSSRDCAKACMMEGVSVLKIIYH